MPVELNNDERELGVNAGSDSANLRADLVSQPPSGRADLSRRRMLTSGIETGLLILTVGIGAWAAWAASRATQLMERSLNLEEEPHLYLTQSDEEIELTSRGFTKNGQITEPFFDIHNAGKSPAVVLALYRRWGMATAFESPPPIADRERGPGIYKENYIPVGPGDSFPLVKGMPSGIEFPIAPGFYVYFYGYIVFSDLSKRTYVRGYCLIFDRGRFHTAWPPKNPELYNYQRRLEHL
jgi:hypothetical protein